MLPLLLGLLFAWLNAPAEQVRRMVAGEHASRVEFDRQALAMIREAQGVPAGAESMLPHLAAAAREYEAALERTQHVLDPEGSPALPDYDALGVPPDPDSPFEPAMIAAWRARAEAMIQELAAGGAFDHLRRAAAAPDAAPIGEEADGGRLKMAPLRRLARCRGATMRLAAARGDWPSVTESFDQYLAVGRAAYHSPTLIARILANAIVNLACRDAAAIVSTHRLDAPTLRAMRSSLDRQTRRPPADLLAEVILITQAGEMREDYTDNGRGDGLLINSRAASTWAMARQFGAVVDEGWMPAGADLVGRGAGVLYASWRETTALIDGFLKDLPEYASLDRPGKKAHPFRRDPDVSRLPRRHLYARRMIRLDHSPVRLAFDEDDSTDTRITGLDILIAIELARAETGQYPGRLEDLVPVYLPCLPIDRVSGLPFVYRLTPGEHRDYQLYSVGDDRVDDGGREDESESGVALRADLKSGRGFDFVVNRAPRP